MGLFFESVYLSKSVLSCLSVLTRLNLHFTVFIGLSRSFELIYLFFLVCVDQFEPVFKSVFTYLPVFVVVFCLCLSLSLSF